MIAKDLTEIKSLALFYELQAFIPSISCYLKLEHLNIAGSIKLKPALAMVQALEKRSPLNESTTIVSSSSGNLGIALAIICKQKRYKFICISDPNILADNERKIKIYGGEVIKVTQKDENGGYLSIRKQLARDMARDNSNYYCVDQYSDIENINAHYNTTAKEIHAEFPELDYLFVGAGTTGTINGCIQYFRKYSPKTKIIGVDAVGSVTYRDEPKKRLIPGLGASTKSEISTLERPSEIVYVEEIDTINMCHKLVEQYGLLLGGSTGTVLAAIKQVAHTLKANSTIVAISPDGGEKYLNVIYNQAWVQEMFGQDLQGQGEI